MKFDSPLFDRIRVKPDADRRPRPAAEPACEWPGCGEMSTHRAPKGRQHEGQYWRFCLDHVRAYNHSYNYFAGMTDDAVQRFQKDALTGHRPTWKMGTPNSHAGTETPFGRHGPADPFGMFRDIGGHGPRVEAERVSEGRMIRNAERKALETMGIDGLATKDQIKARFKVLVKRHHPDANGGDTSCEDKLREIIEAYNYLKTAGFC